MPRSRIEFPWIGCLVAVCAMATRLPGADDIDFGRDIRPILSQNCFKCHGPDDTRREAELRLDERDGTLRPSASGQRPIVPGNPSQSEVIRRIESNDPDLQMPPPSTKRALTADEKSMLRKWITAGAPYRAHWSFVPPQRPELPAVQQRTWPRDGLDQLVLARLEQEGLTPSVEADRYSLLRRAALDLTGLPPTPDEADEFARDGSPDAWERQLDRLLASPHYGERGARRWLDLARYADTNGYEKDRVRSVWPYRDWVISALNANMPFDQFTIEQLAGDMLPQATEAQRIATGFHRNTMLNEEGGIDPLEFRFYAMTDRVATTATAWLGLTLSCAQCHTHKYDPITHTDYYRLFALLNNADEPEMDVYREDVAQARAALQKSIAALQADLPRQFPLPDEFEWTSVPPSRVTSAQGAQPSLQPDGVVLIEGPNPDQDRYEWTATSDLSDVVAVRLQVLSDERLPSRGPGRTPHGNFVLSELAVHAGPGEGPDNPAVRIIRAAADFSQQQFAVEQAIDGQSKSGGWAIHGPDPWNVNRTATFILEKPIGSANAKTHWTISLDQQFGKQHTIGKFRIQFGRRTSTSTGSEADQRQKHLARKFESWLDREQSRTARWSLLRPTEATSNLPLLTIETDGSIVASGDMSKRDLYDVRFPAPSETDPGRTGPPWTALRIEAIADDRFPRRGPGRVYYEGPFGDFFLSEIGLRADGEAVPLTGATQSFANGGNTAASALDGNQQTGWSIQGGQGRTQVAVFRFQKPVARTARFDLSLLFERYYAAGLGRFRVWLTDATGDVSATSLPLELEVMLLDRKGNVPLDDASKAKLLAHYCEVSEELAPARAEIAKLQSQLPTFPTALVFQERPANNPRPTQRYHRGEFLQPKERVLPANLSALPPLPAGEPATRLTLARWLVSPANPLGARVAVNREWAALFGRGLVRTVEDFGSQGSGPTHPELLDFLALELQGQSAVPVPRWNMKRLHRRIASSATYRQSSQVSPVHRERDPGNQWLARGPRQRLDAETLRDSALKVSGLLSEKLLGPSVFPIQPAGVTTEGTYGGLAWNVSPGEDRFRRSLYTFSKRTAPFALGLTFDAPSGEACIARREVTNTPLQALSLMNDPVFVEAARSLGRDFAAIPGSTEDRVRSLIRRALVRPAGPDEINRLTRFINHQRQRLEAGELDAPAISGDSTAAARDIATWTLAARLVLNLDETIMND